MLLPQSIDQKKISRLQKLLLDLWRNPEDRGYFWPWLQGKNGKPIKRLSKKNANKFMLGCIIDYQIDADKALGNAARLAEVELGDPENLWQEIIDVCHGNATRLRQLYPWFHRLDQAYQRVIRIGRDIIRYYDGDARLIWEDTNRNEVLRRFHELSLGPQLSNMALGALMDTDNIKGTGDAKADNHVRRVVGRLLLGRTASVEEATELTRKLYPQNPWKFDSVLYAWGKDICFKFEPLCTDCSLAKECAYYKTIN